MTFSITSSVFDLLPALRVGILSVKGANNAGEHPEITQLLRDAEASVRLRFTEENYGSDPGITAFQEAHRAFGNNPKRYYPSHYALLKRVIKGGTLPLINPLVDLYNTLSLRYTLPVGGEDLDRSNGNILLDRAEGSEPFIPLGETNNDPPDPGEVVYKDDTGVLCRKMNWRESDRTKLSADTKNLVLVVESLLPTDALEDILEELSDLVSRFCGGSQARAILTRGSPMADL